MKALPIVVVGSGLAGLWTALNCAPRPVLLLTAGTCGQACSSAWAQGGIAAALARRESLGAHFRSDSGVVLEQGPIGESAEQPLTG